MDFRQLLLFCSLTGTSLVLLMAGEPDVARAAAKRHSTKHGIVLHVGDSFVNAGLQQHLRPKFHAMSTGYVVDGKRMGQLAWWALGHRLDDLRASYHPALILITLGANDLMYRPASERAYQVHRLVKQTRGTPCVWISPPVWKNAPMEFVEMIRTECAPCRFFDSNQWATQITRQRDNRHPDDKGGALWADKFWHWLMKNRAPKRSFWALKPAPPQEHAPRDVHNPWNDIR